MSFILGMFCLMTWQIVERVKIYLSQPVAINVEIKYEQQMKFPVILLCNLNEATISGEALAILRCQH